MFYFRIDVCVSILSDLLMCICPTRTNPILKACHNMGSTRGLCDSKRTTAARHLAYELGELVTLAPCGFLNISEPHAPTNQHGCSLS